MKLLKVNKRVEKFVFAAISAEYNFEQKATENQERFKSEIRIKLPHGLKAK